MAKALLRSLLIAFAIAVAGCGGGSNSGNPEGTSPPPPQSTPDAGCTGSCANAQSFLSQGDIKTIIAQAAAEAQAQGMPAVIAVVDRVGNVLAVYRMNSAPETMTITSNRGVVGGLEGLKVPSELAAISKAITGAYLSSEGDAFSTRTASQIVQEHFNPGSLGNPGGPLFGVQFSQLPCSDLTTHLANGMPVSPGPHNAPLGLSADPGGFPLYKGGALVGGIGIAADGVYGLDLNIEDKDHNVDELIATAGTYGFGAPTDRRADTITVGGISLRFSDVGYSDLATDPKSAPPYSSLSNGGLAVVPDYFGGTIVAGSAFGQPDSGIVPDSTYYPGLDAFVLTDATGNNRFPPIAGTNGAGALTAHEVQVIEQQALMVANRARAQIRNPLGSQARVSVSVVDTNGVALAVARTRDAPIFGTDVSLQKARTAALNSSAGAASIYQSLAPVNYFSDNVDLGGGKVDLSIVAQSNIGDYVSRVRSFLGLPNALGDGAVAFTDRAGGNMSRPFYPDGVDGNPNGPFSHPFAQWSPFQDGLQLDLVYNAVAFNLVFYLQSAGLTVNLDGNALPTISQPTTCNANKLLANGIQVFPGSVPIYRGDKLVGGIGVSGDGVDQDDMVSFLGLYNAGVALNGSIANAPPAMRADNLAPLGAHLRYIQCPQAPFLDSNDSNVCDGK